MPELVKDASIFRYGMVFGRPYAENRLTGAAPPPIKSPDKRIYIT